MTQYVGLDVSLKTTALCVVDHHGELLAEGKVASEPGSLADWLGAHAPEAHRIGMETGPLSVWLWNELKERGLPVHVIDARYAKAGLALQASKDRPQRRPGARADHAHRLVQGGAGEVQGGAPPARPAGQPRDARA